MLYKVEIDNFYSIAEPQIIDLRARKSVGDILGRLSPVHEGSDWRCPNVVALFGANAAGKTCVLKAIAFGAWFVAKSNEFQADQLPYQKFGTASKIAGTTRLSFSFSGPVDYRNEAGDGPQCPYTYELVLSDRSPKPGETRSISPDSISLEKLSFLPRGHGKPTTIIERRHGHPLRCARGFLNKGHASALKAILRPRASVFATLAQLNHGTALRFVKWVTGIETNVLFDQIESNEVTVARWYASNPAALAELENVGKRIDLGIEQIKVVDSIAEPMMEFTHSGLEQKVHLPLESHGTRRFVGIFPRILMALERGSTVILDDLDSAIHPLLIPEMVRWFNDERRNPCGAQLWMTCHSPSLMSELAKEGILLCEKDRQGRTEVYGLMEIEGVRRGENFFGKYMSGEYGAVPNIG